MDILVFIEIGLQAPEKEKQCAVFIFSLFYYVRYLFYSSIDRDVQHQILVVHWLQYEYFLGKGGGKEILAKELFFWILSPIQIGPVIIDGGD